MILFLSENVQLPASLSLVSGRRSPSLLRSLNHPLRRLAAKDRSELAAFIFETQKQCKITNHALFGRAGISASTLRKLRKGAQISDKSLFRLVRAAEQLRHETEPVAAVNARWLQKLREFLSLVGVKTSWRSCWASLGHISGEC